MFRHVQKQRKLAESNKELQLSDEDSSGNSASEGEEDSASEQSGSEDESGDEESGDEEEGSEGEESAGQEEEEELLPPPPGYPTAEEALKNPIALPDSDGLATADIVPVCVVCPSKALKPGKMLEVHLGSKDHTRRLKRFTSHVLNTSFPSSSLAVDARSISAQLDTIILARLSAQTQFGGPSAPTKRKAPPSPPLAAAKKVQPTLEALRALVNPTVNDLKNLAAMERRSLRAVQREARSKKNLAKRMARREKFARLKTATKAAGRELTKEERKALLKVAKVEKPGVKRPVKPKPSQAEIDARQAAKKLAREAATAAGNPPPAPIATPKPISGKPYVPKADKKLSAKRVARTAERGSRKAALGKKEPFVLGLP